MQLLGGDQQGLPLQSIRIMQEQRLLLLLLLQGAWLKMAIPQQQRHHWRGQQAPL
jgi:hypothetical protein